MNKTKIVIIGGGFGGINTAKHLSRLFNCKNAEITLINKTNYFLFTPLLHEVATGGLSPRTVIEPIREIFRGTCINFVEDSVTEIDTTAKKALTSSKAYDYDYAVVSIGAETNYFGIPGTQENTFPLKNLQDAITLRNHIIETCEEAVATKNKELLTFVVIGAGPTGIELAAELLEYVEHTICAYHRNSGFVKEDIKVSVITATPDILSQFPEKMRVIGQRELERRGIRVIANAMAIKVDPHSITFKDGSIVKAHTLIWVAGVTPSLSRVKGLDGLVKGRVEVNEYLQYTKAPGIFALGDASGSFPMLAQVAVEQAKVVAHNLYTLTRPDFDARQLKKFSFFQKGLLVSLGQWHAVGTFGKITLSGGLMWWIWRTVYLFNYPFWKKRFEVAAEWTMNLFYPRNISSIK